MSLFASLMGDVDEDPFFMGGHMRQMNHMMNSFFRDPFQDMMVPMLTDVNHMRGGNHMQRGAANQLAIPGDLGGMMGGGLMPFGFPHMPGMPNIGRMFPDLGAANGHMTSMSTVMTMSAGPDGRPQVYQASTSTRQGPGGVRETKKTVSDSRTGVKKMSIGHHIYDRAHIIEREHNVHTGQQEEQQEFINLDEDEADEFNKEWEVKTKSTRNAIGYGGQNPRRHRREREPQLALPSSSSADETHQPSSSRAVRNARYPKSTKPSSTSAAARIAHSSTSQKRKNDEKNEDEPKNKSRYYVNQDVVDIEEVESDDEKAESDSAPQVVSDSEDDKNCSSDKE